MLAGDEGLSKTWVSLQSVITYNNLKMHCHNIHITEILLKIPINHHQIHQSYFYVTAQIREDNFQSYTSFALSELN